ncbi:MAG: translation elongation factor Ts [Bacteroidota bacterium]|nr:translation elongation factor Ts [Bacteroidota bacterium]
MAITSELVKLLRDKTGAGMMDCKKALEETTGDLDKAIEYLRKKGAATAQKRADKAAKEGTIVTRVNGKNDFGIIVEINCETDFVARGNDFVTFSELAANIISSKKPVSLEQLLDVTDDSGKAISQHLNDMMAKIGERIEIRRYKMHQTENGFIASYTHMGNKIGVLIELSSTPGNALQIGRDIAMQIAAMNPLYISRDQVSHDVIQRELEIYRTQARNEGKPDQIIERIANGKLEKYYQDVCLSEQVFIKDSSKTIKDVLTESSSGLTIKSFERFQLGEEK